MGPSPLVVVQVDNVIAVYKIIVYDIMIVSVINVIYVQIGLVYLIINIIQTGSDLAPHTLYIPCELI